MHPINSLSRQSSITPNISENVTKSKCSMLTSCLSDKLGNLRANARSVLKRLNLFSSSSKTQYVYHVRKEELIGNMLIPLNSMVGKPEFEKIYESQSAKYNGREALKQRVIYPLKCLWNDVIFLSPLNPKYQYAKYKELGYSLPKPIVREVYQIPVEVLKDKRIAIWKAPNYSDNQRRYEASEFGTFDWKSYKEMEKLNEASNGYYTKFFDSNNPSAFPPYAWTYIPHVLCQDPIDLRDKRIKLLKFTIQ